MINRVIVRFINLVGFEITPNKLYVKITNLFNHFPSSFLFDKSHLNTKVYKRLISGKNMDKINNLNDVQYVKQKLVDDNFLESIISVLTLGVGGFVLNKFHKRNAEKEARQRGCLCAFREDVFPLPYVNESVHKWRLYNKCSSTERYTIDTGIVFSVITGCLESGKDGKLKYDNPSLN